MRTLLLSCLYVIFVVLRHLWFVGSAVLMNRISCV